MADYDCLLIGHYELDFQQYYNILDNMASSGGRDHVAFTDLQLNHVSCNGKPYQAMDILTHFYNEGRPQSEQRNFYNGDCLWTAIAYLGSFLAKRGFTFDYVNLFHLEKEELKQKLESNTYRLIALTGTMYVFEQNIWEVVTFIRKCKRDAKIIAGGPYISKQAEEREPEYLRPLFRYLNADFYCYAREGEQTLVKLLQTLKEGGDPANVPNLAFKKGREFVITPHQRESNPLADNMVDYARFAAAYRASGWANVRVSDGCPYACAFCAFPEHNNQRYEIMSLERIQLEFDAIRDSGAISHIFFIDATLNVPPRQFKEMMRMMIRNRYDFKWHCFLRCDHADEETVHLMQEAGCEGVFLGLESANETVLKNMDKSAHKEDFRRTMPWFKAAGLRQMVSVQVGFPGETYASFRETLAFVEEINPDFVRIQTWFCDPTTPVWFKRDQFKLQGKGYGWSHYTMDAETAVELVVEAFMSLRASSWVPDPGYNWVSFYQMQKKGMSMERQKMFIRFFTAVAKERLLRPKTREIPAALWENFRASARFDVEGPINLKPLENHAGERYVAAESFWVDEFRVGDGVVSREQLSHGAGDNGSGAWIGNGSGHSNGNASALVQRNGHGLENGVAGSGAERKLRDDLLAAYAVLLLGLRGEPGTAVVVAPDEEDPFPLRMRADAASSFREVVDVTRRRWLEATTHRRYAFFILTHALRMKEHGLTCPPLTAAYMIRESDAGRTTLESRLVHHPKVFQNLDLVLTLTSGAQPDQATFELSSPCGKYGEETLEQWQAYLSIVLARGSDDPALLLGALPPVPQSSFQVAVAAAPRTSPETSPETSIGARA